MHHIARDPWFVPRTGILVARTCIDCGGFFGASWFWHNKRFSRRSECKRCAKERLHKPPSTAWRVPRTGFLVAKTCIGCGNLLDAHRFWCNGKPGRYPACARCSKKRAYKAVQRRRAA